MGRADNIDFNRDTVKRKTRGRIILAVCAAFVCGAALFIALLAKNDFSFTKFIGLAETDASDAPEASSDENPSEPAALFSDKNAPTILLVCADEREVTFCDVISFSKSENSVKVKPVSPELKLSYAGREQTLRELFRDFGAYEIAEALGEKNIGINRYICVTEQNFKSLIQKLGNVSVYFPNDVDFSVDSIRYQYYSGTHEISSDALLNVMKNAFSGDSALSFQANAVAGILKTYFTPALFEKDDSFFSGLLNLISGNVSALDLADHKSAIIEFLSGEPEIIVLS